MIYRVTLKRRDGFEYATNVMAKIKKEAVRKAKLTANLLDPLGSYSLKRIEVFR